MGFTAAMVHEDVAVVTIDRRNDRPDKKGREDASGLSVGGDL
jgi:4-hydroxybenzoate polyprenyltransferase